MRRYFDTCFLVPLFLSEGTTNQIQNFFKHLPSDNWVVSEWTRVEFVSTLAREVRARRQDEGVARDTIARFEMMVEKSFDVIVPRKSDFDHVRELLGSFKTSLKPADALHVAIASHRDAEVIYTLDNEMIAAGRILKLPISNAGIVPNN